MAAEEERGREGAGGVVGRLLDEFLLRRAERLAVAVASDVRGDLERAVQLLRQRTWAADSLLAAGHPAEALRLARDALAVAREVVLALREAGADGGEGGPGSFERTLRGRGMRPSLVTRAVEVVRDLDAAELPELDVDVSERQLRLVGDVLTVCKAVAGLAGAALRSEQHWSWMRTLRILVAIVVVTAIALVVRPIMMVDSPAQPAAMPQSAQPADSQQPIRASGERPGGAFGASKAVDGDPKTFWLLPDTAPGWLDVELSPPRRVEIVEVLNAPGADTQLQGTKDYRIRLFTKDGKSKSWGGSFVGDGSWQRHEVALDGVARIRFLVLTVHGQGGGLAEMTWK